MSSVIGIALICVGVAFNILGCVGLIRLPDVYNRLQAGTKCVTFGTCSVLLGTALLTCATTPAIAAKCLLCMAFVLITAPTAAHALARGAHASGVRLCDKSVVDRYQEDHEPGVSEEETT